VIAVAIALALPETRRDAPKAAADLRRCRPLFTSRAIHRLRAVSGAASQIIFAFAGGGPISPVTQMGRSSAEYGACLRQRLRLFDRQPVCVRFAPRHSLEKLIWFGWRCNCWARC